MRRAIRVGLGVVGLVAVLPGGAIRAQRPASDECSLPSKGAFSVGFVAEQGGRHYRCLETYDSNLKPAGVAWIEVVRDNRFIIKD